MRIVKRLCGLLFLCVASAASVTLYGVILLYIALTHDLPDVRLLREPDGVAKLMAPPDFALNEYHPVTFEELPPHVVNAFLAASDQRFFTDRKMRLNKGGCRDPIFQELAGGLLPENRLLFSRRARWLILMAHMELLLTREQVFTAWLNSRRFGYGPYGLEAASRFYFAKSVAKLSLAEAAALAAMPKDLARVRSLETYMKLVRQRQEWVLRRMLDIGAVTREAYDAALAAPLEFMLCQGLQFFQPERP